MGWENSNPYEYHPERGLYYHEVAKNLICGSQPQTREDIEHLKFKEHVTNIVNLQVRLSRGHPHLMCKSGPVFVGATSAWTVIPSSESKVTE